MVKSKYFQFLWLFICSVFFITNAAAQCNPTDKTSIAVASIVPTLVDCPQNGTITVNGVTGGGGEYVYEIIYGPIIRGIQSQNVFAALLPGKYKIRVTGCNSFFYESDTIVVGNQYLGDWDPAVYFLSEYSFNCNTTNTGKALLDVYLRLPNDNCDDSIFFSLPLRYQVSTDGNLDTGFNNSSYNYFSKSKCGGDDFDITDTLSNLTAGTTYYIKVTDMCGVFRTTSIVVPAIVPSAIYTFDFKVKEPFKVPNSGNYVPMLKGNCVQWGELSLFENGNPISVIPSTNTFAPYNVVIKRQDNDAVIVSKIIVKGIPLNDYSNIPLGIFDSIPRVPVRAEITDQCGNLTVINANTPLLKEPFKVQANAYCGYSSNGFLISMYSATPSLPLRYKIYNSANVIIKDTLVISNSLYAFLRDSANDPNPYNILTSYGEYRIACEDQCGMTDSIVYNFQPGTSSPAPDFKYNTHFYNCSSPVSTGFCIVNAQQISPAQVYYKKIISGPPGLTYPREEKIRYAANIAGIPYTFNENYFDSLVAGTYQMEVSYGCKELFTTSFTVSNAPTYQATGYLEFVTTNSPCSTNPSGVAANGKLTSPDAYTNVTDPVYVRVLSAPMEFLQAISISKDGSDPVLPFNLGDFTAISTLYNGIDTNIINVYPKVFYGLSIYYSALIPGDYTFQIYSKCSGSILDTKSYTIDKASYSKPNLGASSGYICENGAVKAVASPIGGKRPFTYQIKLASDPDDNHYSPFTSDSIFILPANTLPGTVYNLRARDACNNSFTGQVVVNSFTGNLYIAVSKDCIGAPSRIITGYIPGAIYTWTKPDGSVIITNSNEMLIQSFSIADIGMYTVVANALDGCISKGTGLVVGRQCYSTLPLDVLNFSAVKINQNTVHLSWETANATPDHHFEIERSTDGISWNKIAQQPANVSGGSTKKLYNYRDIVPDIQQKSVFYYRIKQANANGKVNYTTVKKVYFSTAFALLKVYPTPFVSAVSIDFISESTEKAVVSLFDMGGREVSRSVMPVNKGVNHYQYAPVLHIEAGNYLLTLTQGVNRFTQKVVKIN